MKLISKRLIFCLVHVTLILAFYFLFVLITKYPEWRRTILCENRCLGFWSKSVMDTKDFTNFDNERGRRDGRYVVPNYVHFFRIGRGDITFSEALCLWAALKHQKPLKLFLHIDYWPTGKYWDTLNFNDEFVDVLLPVTGASIPFRINGRYIDQRVVKEHGILLAKLLILTKYGGIILDNNSYLVRSLNDFRRYEMTLDGNETGNKTTKIIIANKNARLLNIWIESCLNTYNLNTSTDLNNAIYYNHPHLFHREKYFFADDEIILINIFYQYWSDWENHYVLHLPDEKDDKYPTYDEKNITRLIATIKWIVLKVYPVH